MMILFVVSFGSRRVLGTAHGKRFGRQQCCLRSISRVVAGASNLQPELILLPTPFVLYGGGAS